MLAFFSGICLNQFHLLATEDSESTEYFPSVPSVISVAVIIHLLKLLSLEMQTDRINSYIIICKQNNYCDNYSRVSYQAYN